MDFTELDSFICKFKQIWKSGQSARLNLETEAGQAWVGLHVRLGQAPGPLHQGPQHHQAENRTRDSLSRQRRRARREAEREAARASATEEVRDAATEEVREAELAVDASDTFEATEVGSTIVVEENINKAEQAREDFSCDICDFKSNWENGLAIHISRKHAKLEQVDGSTSISEDFEDNENEKYSSTLRYWKDGKLGTAFQSYLDAIEIIETSNLSEDLKDVEKSKVLEARKKAFGSEFEYYPPWKLR